ncbi:MAG: alanine racemase [Rhodospirillaceae bacterium]|jgi:alanine racemase|nr:alanine racemase [Rhodospirillaceae bacterium]MBT6118515.1 alanine racemase [Rhodospirillaceae bacterium]
MAAGSTVRRSTGSVLEIDLGAIQENYRRLLGVLDGVPSAAVVKADGYGLGTAQVATALRAAGCRIFFVAHLGEAADLRETLPDAEIFVLNGALPGAEADFVALDLRPVLNGLGDIERWAALARAEGRVLAAALHLDTGMARLGLPADELDSLADAPSRLDGIALRYVMSHLACAEEADNPMNETQRRAFEDVRARLPAAPGCFANSSGVFLGSGFHFDLARPGVALYGANPTPGRANPMAGAVRLSAPILQVRAIDPPASVGYGATHKIDRPARIATVAVGYADGYLRSLSSSGRCHLGGYDVAVAGRISMDLITLDVTGVPAEIAHPGAEVEIIGPGQTIDQVAERADTIPYEILTSLGRRYSRVYTGGTD